MVDLFGPIAGLVIDLVRDGIKAGEDERRIKKLLEKPVKDFEEYVRQWAKSENANEDDALAIAGQVTDWLHRKVGLQLQHFDSNLFDPNNVFAYLSARPSYPFAAGKPFAAADKSLFDRLCRDELSLIRDGLIQTAPVHDLLQITLARKLDDVSSKVVGIVPQVLDGVGGLLHKYTDDPTLGVRVQILTDELLSKPADSKVTRRFYEGAPLDWEIIAADADIPRDQGEGLLEALARPYDGLRFVCLVAEPGAGKSTTAWRAAADLHRKHGAFVVRVIDNEDASVWYQLSAFCQKLNKPLYVLVDDLFRDDDVLRAVRELSPSLPLTILATSRTNEFRPGRIKARELVRLDLKRPSEDEKDRILNRLGKDRSDLTPEQSKRLDAANQFLVLMMELTEGKDLQTIVRDSLERLEAGDSSAYRAYEYLTFAGRFDIPMPESLLDSLDEYFHGLFDRDTCQGLVFRHPLIEGLVRVGHALIAETAYRHYEARRTPAAVLRRIAEAVNHDEPSQRGFLAHLLRSLATITPGVIGDVLLDIDVHTWRCIRSSRTISELAVWRSFLVKAHLRDQASRCEEHAMTFLPLTSTECSLLISLYRHRGLEKDALLVASAWLSEHTDEIAVRETFLGLVERQGTPEQVERALLETSVWLAEHMDDHSVRTAYLGPVERKGTPEQAERALSETSAWLAEHLDDTSVRTAYLGLVERKGASEQVEQVLLKTSAWLAEHLDDNYVRTAYLGLVERRGVSEQVEQVLLKTSAWLAEHLDDTSVRTAYLGLVERKGASEQVEQVLLKTSAWLAEHLDDTSVRTAYLGLVERRGTPEQVERVLSETSAWLAEHLDDSSVRMTYLGLVERKGTPEQIESVVLKTRHWLTQQPADTAVRKGLIALLIRSGRMKEAGAIASEAIIRHPEDRNLISHYLRLFQDADDREMVKGMYEKLTSAHPRDDRSRLHFAAWLRENEYVEEARTHYELLVTTRPNWFQARYGYGCLLFKLSDFHGAAAQFRQVLAMHKGHQASHDGLGRALHGLGLLNKEAGNATEASSFFASAEAEYRQAVYWAERQGQNCGAFYGDMGWNRLAQERYTPASNAFESAIHEQPEHFANYWGLGKALMSLGRFHSAAEALRTALDKAPEDLQPPANEEIPALLQDCIAKVEE